MTRIPDAMLAELHPLVSAWVAEQERLILEQGDTLTGSELQIAAWLTVSFLTPPSTSPKSDPASPAVPASPPPRS
jgi:hypothetical protein